MINLKKIQAEHHKWQLYNFSDFNDNWVFEGMVEELGELAQARLKARQNIKGSKAEWRLKERDSIGDLIMFIIGYCSRQRWDVEKVISETWAEVKKRDWVKYPLNGIDK